MDAPNTSKNSMPNDHPY